MEARRALIGGIAVVLAALSGAAFAGDRKDDRVDRCEERCDTNEDDCESRVEAKAAECRRAVERDEDYERCGCGGDAKATDECAKVCDKAEHALDRCEEKADEGIDLCEEKADRCADKCDR